MNAEDRSFFIPSNLVERIDEEEKKVIKEKMSPFGKQLLYIGISEEYDIFPGRIKQVIEEFLPDLPNSDDEKIV